MKRLAIIAVMVLMGLSASANSIRYFTHGQAQRTVRYLNAQNEMVIYCGYDYEIETYVLINEVWMERVNSAYYEIWVYGFDAYTGDEIYMPLDLQCVWLYSAGRLYSAAQYLRFHASVNTPRFTWHVPPYNPFTRTMHRHGYTRSYHYDIHRHGWMPPAPPRHGYGPHTQPPLPPYYMRTPQEPAPTPTAAWTPGVEHPQVSTTGTRSGSSTITTNRTATGSSQATPRSTSGNDRSSGTATTGTPRSGSSTTSSPRGNDNSTATTTAGGRGGSTTTGPRGNDSGTGTTTSGRSGSSTTGTRGTATPPTRSNTGTTSSTDKPATAPRNTGSAVTGGRGNKTDATTTTTTSSRGGKTETTTTTSPRGGKTGTTTTTTGGRGGQTTTSGRPSGTR